MSSNSPWSKRRWFNYSAHNGKIWLLAGQDPNNAGFREKEFGNLNDIWSSSDGLSWDLAQSNELYLNRHASFLWNTNLGIYISSGFGTNEVSRMYNDVFFIPNRDNYLPKESHKLFIFPNPVNDVLNVVLNDNSINNNYLSFSISNIFGQIIVSEFF